MSCTSRHLIAFLACAAISGLLGCGRPDEFTRHRVSGTVTFNGRPVPAGKIYFNPDAGAGNDGPPAYAEIVNGAFDTSASKGRNAISGPHQVVINGYEPASAPADSEFGNAKALFGEYRTSVVLPEAVSQQTFNVPAAASKTISY